MSDPTAPGANAQDTTGSDAVEALANGLPSGPVDAPIDPALHGTAEGSTAAPPAEEPALVPGDTFPRQYARTQRLTLGEPRTFTVSPDGRRVVFVRSDGGSDPVHRLSVLDVLTGDERVVADPAELLGGGEEDLPPEERARRERAREAGAGVVAYACDPDVRVVAFPLGGRLFVGGLISGRARELPVAGPVVDPHPDPTARRLAYVSGPRLCIAELDGTSRVVCADDDPQVTWGSAEHVAAEEMGRARGYWWAPDGERLAVTRVDTRPVTRWWIADPANPQRPPTEVAYPAAGTANAVVQLFVVGLDGARTEVTWDRAAFPYLARVAWTGAAGLTLLVQSRDQRRVALLVADPATGGTQERWADTDPVWVELVAGAPAFLPDGRVVACADRDGVRRLCIDGIPVTPTHLQVRAVAAVDQGAVLFHANLLDEPADLHVWRWSDADGAVPLTTGPGVHTGWAGGGTLVLRRAGMDHDGGEVTVVPSPALVATVDPDGDGTGDPPGVGPWPIASRAETPLLRASVTFLRLGARRLPTALLLPSQGVPEGVRLPVLLDPYGGPHAQRVVRSRNAHATSQWFADQGFAVVVVDGRGTPGLGSEWERSVHLDLAGPVLDDQLDALAALGAADERLDLSRVGIRGWSFGGYLAALAVLRRPDAVHAAVAGAPVTEWRLYDTHYTERYLGDPTADPTPYDRTSLLADAGQLQRPLLLVHGLADDNVVAAHTLQLSSALLAAGRAHSVLPLSGVTHMTPQEQVAENLLLLQLRFLQSALGLHR